MNTAPREQGTWKLITPSGREFAGDSPLKCFSAERAAAGVTYAQQVENIQDMVEEPDVAERHMQLAAFYSVRHVDDLVDSMHHHIEKLQQKLEQYNRLSKDHEVLKIPRIG